MHAPDSEASVPLGPLVFYVVRAVGGTGATANSDAIGPFQFGLQPGGHNR